MNKQEGKTMIDDGLVERAAAAAHEANRFYCRALGDHSQGSWAETLPNIQDSARTGVRAIVDNPKMTPADQHQCWLDFKKADGWVYGENKDNEAKTHHCMVPYDDLPDAQKTKDLIFGTIVRTVLGLAG